MKGGTNPDRQDQEGVLADTHPGDSLCEMREGVLDTLNNADVTFL